jgi:hypothetical protein
MNCDEDIKTLIMMYGLYVAIILLFVFFAYHARLMYLERIEEQNDQQYPQLQKRFIDLD